MVFCTSIAGEARVFAGLVARGVSTVDRAREIISVGPAEESALLKILHPQEVCAIVVYRRSILKLFDRLVSDVEHARTAKRRRMSARVLKCPPSERKRGELSAAV
jgi:hypothetical protein